MEVVASLSQGRTAAAQCGLFTHKSVPVIFEPPCIPAFAWTQQRKITKNLRCFGGDSNLAPPPLRNRYTYVNVLSNEPS